MAEKIKPCPFCGSVEALKVFDSLCVKRYFVACRDGYSDGCGATGGYAETEEEAIKLWNRRVREEV